MISSSWSSSPSWSSHENQEGLLKLLQCRFFSPSTIISESAFDGGNYDEDEDGANQCKCCFSWPSLIPPLTNNTNQGCICSHVCEEKYTSSWEDALGRYYWLRDMNVDIKGDQWITHREGMMTDVSDATFVWKVLNKTGQILHIKWKILCKYLKKKKYLKIRWSGCLEDTIYKYLAKINRSDKYLRNIWEIFEKYLRNICGIIGLELMTGIGCCEPIYCLDPTIGPTCHCSTTLIFTSSSSSILFTIQIISEKWKPRKHPSPVHPTICNTACSHQLSLKEISGSAHKVAKKAKSAKLMKNWSRDGRVTNKCCQKMHFLPELSKLSFPL